LDIYYNATYEKTAGGSIKGNAKVHGSDEITITPDQHYSVDKVLFTVKDKNGNDVEKELSLTNGKYLMPDYDFNNWTGDCKVTASFKLVKYHVEFLDGDETVLKSDDLEYGKFPSYTGKTPEKQESETSTFTFDGWTNGSEIYGLNEKLPEITGDVTYTPVFKENTKPVYTVGEVKGDGINSDIVIDVHRNVDDENCIDYFGSATIDGKDMKVNEQYTVTKGSTIITIKKDFLSTLTAGEHEVKIIFSDGSITTKVTVAAKAPAQAQDPAKTNSAASIPSTGEATSASTYTGLALVVAACVCGTGVVLLKKRKEA
jgi:LPXTG-motif cell wall-anchored protein